MKTYYYSLLLLGCGVIYSFFNPGGSSGGGRKSEAENGAANNTIVEPGPAAEKDLGNPDESTYPQKLCEQFADECKPVGTDGNGSRPNNKLRDDIKEPSFIIATVPNPTTTHLRVEFDRSIDGIKDAAADENYLFRRYWFPWPLELPPQFSDRVSQQSEDKQREAKQRLPGFLLLENENHRSLIVLLVGESPTDGVDRQQFDGAVKLKRKIEEMSNTSTPRFYILGTSFSGSLHTLDLALSESQNDVDNFEAVSGTVHDRKSIESFNKRHKHGLRTLTHDSVTTLKAFRNFLRNTWDYNDRIAILSETDTVFGALQGLRGDDDFFPIPFPRDIAHLRNAYQSYPELSGFGPANPDLQQRKNLPLPLDDTRNTINSIPDFAAQTVVSQETMVTQIANRIRHEHIGFAGIIGTDVLDVLFISRFIRAASPDTRLFLLDSDLLFVHAADALPFEGVLAVTTYPLLDGNPPLKHGIAGETHWMFPTPFQQGIHNAMRVLMADMAGKAVPPLPGYDIYKPEDKEPALWITSVGRESFVPAAVLGDADMAGAELKQKESLVPMPEDREPLFTRAPHDPTRIWWILFLTVTFAMAGLALVFHRAQKSSAAWLNDFRMQGGAGNRQHLSLLLVFATGIYLVVVSTGTPVLVYPAPFIFAVIGLAAIGYLAWLCLTRIKLKTSKLWGIGLAAAGVAALVVLFVSLSYNPAHLRGVFFRFRSFEISAGAAPTIPFLFLLGGFLIFSFVGLERNIFHHQRAPFLPRASCDPVLGGNVWQRAQRLRRQLHRPFGRSRMVGTVFTATAFVLCYTALHQSEIRSFEGVWYDRLFTVWASALAAALVVVCRNFVESWRLFSRTLDQMETHPLRRALSALPAGHTWSPIWQSSPRKRSYLLATRSIDALVALRDTGLCSPELTMLIGKAEKRVRAILGQVARGKRETTLEHLGAEKALAQTADRLVRGLQPVWNRGSSDIVDESKEAGKQHEDEQPPLIYAFEFVAMRYLAFIHYVMLQLRNMLTFLTLGFMAFAFALMSYPFEGERLIAWVITSLFVTLSSGIMLVFIQMETHATLSRLTNRDAGKLGFEFFHRVLAFGALPLLTVLASNFNGVARLLFSWIQPALKTLH